MADFSTSAELELEVSNRSLRDARSKIEQELGEIEVGVSTSGAGGDGSRNLDAILDSSRQQVELLELQVELLDEIEENFGEGGIAGLGGPGGGGAAGGGGGGGIFSVLSGAAGSLTGGAIGGGLTAGAGASAVTGGAVGLLGAAGLVGVQRRLQGERPSGTPLSEMLGVSQEDAEQNRQQLSEFIQSLMGAGFTGGEETSAGGTGVASRMQTAGGTQGVPSPGRETGQAPEVNIQIGDVIADVQTNVEDAVDDAITDLENQLNREIGNLEDRIVSASGRGGGGSGTSRLRR